MTSGRRRPVFNQRKRLVEYLVHLSGEAGLLLSQLKRSEKRRPEVEDLKESGDLEDAAEHILLGHREQGSGPGERDRRILIVGKNKDGRDDVPDIELREERREEVQHRNRRRRGDVQRRPAWRHIGARQQSATGSGTGGGNRRRGHSLLIGRAKDGT